MCDPTRYRSCLGSVELSDECNLGRGERFACPGEELLEPIRVFGWRSTSGARFAIAVSKTQCRRLPREAPVCPGFVDYLLSRYF